MDASGWGIRKKKGDEGRPYKCTKCKGTFYMTKKERQAITQQPINAIETSLIGKRCVK